MIVMMMMTVGRVGEGAVAEGFVMDGGSGGLGLQSGKLFRFMRCCGLGGIN